MNDGARSPWLWVAGGCFGCLGILVLAVVALGVVGYRFGKDVEDSFNDPERRHERALEVLGIDTLPEGYHAVGAMSLPFVFDMAILSDRERQGEHDALLNEYGFLYFELKQFGGDAEELRVEFRREGFGAVDSNAPFRIDGDQQIAEGSLELGRASLTYRSDRGEVRVEQHDIVGVMTTLLVECPNDDRLRTAVWVGPDPDPTVGPESVDWTGTVADPAAMAAFLDHFAFCGEPR